MADKEELNEENLENVTGGNRLQKIMNKYIRKDPVTPSAPGIPMKEEDLDQVDGGKPICKITTPPFA